MSKKQIVQDTQQMEETSNNRTTKQNEIAFSLCEVGKIGKKDASNESINSIKGSKLITSNREKNEMR